jgi:hypothetical protein
MSATSNSNRLRVGCAVSVGGRDYLEDCITIIANFNEFIDNTNTKDGEEVNAVSRSFFGVYDGTLIMSMLFKP